MGIPRNLSNLAPGADTSGVLGVTKGGTGVTTSTGTGSVVLNTSPSFPANLNFTGTGNRITGDFSNATIANRVAFQTSTTNGNTTINVIPNGTGNVANINVWGNSSLTAASGLNMIVTATEASLRSNISDGGSTYLPLTMYTGGSERLRITTNGGFSFGSSGTAFGSAGQVLTSNGDAAPTWTTPSGGAMVLISTQTPNGTSPSFAWTGLSGYRNYVIIFSLWSSAQGTIYLRTGTGSTPTYSTSAYKQNFIRSLNGSLSPMDGLTNAPYFYFNYGTPIGTFGVPAIAGVINIQNATGNNYIQSNIYYINSGNDRCFEVSGAQTNDTNFTAIQIAASAGNISGTASLYGITS